jgi:hypothetical protein
MPRDGKTIYFSTYGHLYRLESATRKIEHVTAMLPPDEKLEICRVWGLSL